jgi:hypothetical protein
MGVSRTHRLRAVALAFALCACAGPLSAQEFTVRGYLDLRAGWAANEDSWVDGGLGKTRFGGDGTFVSGNAALAAHWQLTPALSASAQVQFAPQQHPSLDVLDAYLAYRPVSTTPWRWSLKAGAFFPPISQENDAVGWTSPWTLSPSAIDSWVGEELRTIGVEARLQHRGAQADVEAFGAVFGGNDPAGELLAARGWSLGDLTSGLDARVREPDVYAPRAEAGVPMRYRPFEEIDGRLGWYAGVAVDAPAYGKLTLLRYDNRGDPTREEEFEGHDVYAWHTRFWSLGGQARLGDVVVVAQAMDGSTAFEPAPGLLLDTHFHAGYVLAAWARGAWRPTLRVDLFDLRQLPDTLAAPLDEHGNALTVALNWRPVDRVRVTGEWMRIDSRRDQRTLAGLAPRQLDRQVQLSVRLLF